MSDDRAENRYDFRAIEQKWQQIWAESGLFRVPDHSDRPKFYALVFFPYPSGAGISIGHCKNYIPLDVVARFKRMQGYNVLHPMGWDAFGQPAENEAIKQGRNPGEMVSEYAANYKRQLNRVGISYDWSREINSSHPDYYRWTQWFFLLLYRRGLAYRGTAPINWCPQCKTGLANEEVVAGQCWRCGTTVEKRPMPQWYFKITAYAERLLAGLDTIQWPEGIKMMQREWIGRSEGAEVDFPVAGSNDTIRIFTTRPDTLWGATFMVLAPEHPLVERLTTPDRRAEVTAYIQKAQRETEVERQATDRVKTGVFLGSYAINPVNNQKIPIYIADYVLMGYGTGAIMAVPAHDQRDFEFARKYHIPITLVYRTDAHQTSETLQQAIPDQGTMCLGPFAGAPNTRDTVRRVIQWLEEQGLGRGVVNYRLRDWLISRQRYWGAPIPMIHCAQCGIVPVPEDQLPVLLPPVEKYQPTGTGESPLAGIPEFVHTTCPQCGAPARRETDTMGGFACSSWYFLRFADPHNDREPFSQRAVDYWLPVDLYSGGAEHAVMHLLYARFWTKVLYDAGLIRFEEPFTRLRNQGMLLAWTPGRRVSAAEAGQTGDETDAGEPIEDWKVLKPEERLTIPEDQWEYRWVKMSKSLRNVVTPDEMAEQYGADSLRLYILFAAPFEETVLWKDAGGVEAANRFLNRVWRIWHDLRPHYRDDWRVHLPATRAGLNADERRLRRKLHQTLRKLGEDIENFRFNTGVAALMEFTNELSAFRNALASTTPTATQQLLISESLETLVLMMAPVTPHMADELWSQLGKPGSTLEQMWPAYEPEAAAEEQITIVVQVNGKVRDRLQVAPDTPQEAIERMALDCEKVRAELNGKQVHRIVSVPGKLVNVVLRESAPGLQ
ncbi:MAG: leucine--tRNA ligase [Chloroherpetonaceae bacterium]|nr:leucine--tRNA ligase [Chthonomonadaceae bacterium]MDW8208672.1 leucine--tRNA ligase [Chloroherpetonaceae bacterium]